MDFYNELMGLLNKHGMENGSDTPDFVLAIYLVACLEAFDKATNARKVWYGQDEECIGDIDEQAGITKPAGMKY